MGFSSKNKAMHSKRICTTHLLLPISPVYTILNSFPDMLTVISVNQHSQGMRLKQMIDFKLQLIIIHYISTHQLNLNITMYSYCIDT